MKRFLKLTVAAVTCFFFSNSIIAQTPKARTNKEILMETVINPDNRVVIKWVSQEDHQVSRFVVQRSKDNDTFFDIREVDVKKLVSGEQSQRLQFAFTDVKMLRGTEYYRIMEYGYDGDVYLYSTMSVKPISPVSIIRNGESSIVRVMVEDSKNLTALMSTESGLGVPCEFELSENNDVILKPAYSLNGGSYLVKLRSSAGEKQIKFSVKADDLL